MTKEIECLYLRGHRLEDALDRFRVEDGHFDKQTLLCARENHTIIKAPICVVVVLRFPPTFVQQIVRSETLKFPVKTQSKQTWQTQTPCTSPPATTDDRSLTFQKTLRPTPSPWLGFPSRRNIATSITHESRPSSLFN